MRPEHWKKVKGILERAIEIPPDSRSVFLDQVCFNDSSLRSEVEELLDFHEPESDILEQNAFNAVMENGKVEFIGRQIGKYKITGELGAGGMGVVFLAERADGEFRQKVALKVIKRGIGTDALRRRFVNERQILASLQHPNIAHLIDGGTTDEDLPYFVMEYVEGTGILEFARRKDLSIEHRLDLFRKVCAAVSYAHQNLVIHRDLKPSNILVGADSAPKLLDFGIAKLLNTESTHQTATWHFAFTPEYASPEQIRGEQLTTATDIYSLGVILYELLTGARPFSFDDKNFGEIVQSVSQTEPIRPSFVSSQSEEKNRKQKVENHRSLKGDLDNIILKSLKREPERRYLTVEQFSEDIRRHLKGLPVIARHDTLFYRAEKFTRRNPFVIGALALAFFILIGGITAVAWQARIADAERAKAERRFNDVRTLANSFMFEINEEMEKSPIKARQLLVTRAVEYLDNLAAEAEGDDGLQSELAAAYEKIGDVQSELFKPSSGRSSEALKSHQKSLEIRQKLFDAEPDNLVRGLDTIKSLSNVGDIFSITGKVSEAAGSYGQAIRINENLLKLNGENTAVRQTLARNHLRLGQAVLRSGALSQALAHYNKALEIYQSLLARNPDDAHLQQSLSITFSYIGYVKMEMGASEESVVFFANALAIMEKRLRTDPDDRQARRDVSIAHLWIGVALGETTDIQKSLVHLERALEIQTQLFETDRENFGEQNGLADCYLELGKVLARKAAMTGTVQSNSARTDMRAAVTAYDTAIKNYEAVRQFDLQNFSVQRQIGYTRRQLADAVRRSGDALKALQLFRETLKDFEELTQKDADNTEWRYDLAICHLRIGEILSEKGELPEAVSQIGKALPLLEELYADSPENVRIFKDLQIARKYAEKQIKNTN